MSVSDIISKALIEYDKATPTIDYLLENTYFKGHKTNNDTQRSTFEFYHKDTREKMFVTEIEV